MTEIQVFVADFDGVETRNARSFFVPDVEIARSIVRGLLSSSRPFVFRACGWECVRGGIGASAGWFPDTGVSL